MYNRRWLEPLGVTYWIPNCHGILHLILRDDYKCCLVHPGWHAPHPCPRRGIGHSHLGLPRRVYWWRLGSSGSTSDARSFDRRHQPSTFHALVVGKLSRWCQSSVHGNARCPALWERIPVEIIDLDQRRNIPDLNGRRWVTTAEKNQKKKEVYFSGSAASFPRSHACWTPLSFQSSLRGS